jgi:hypothetical protein
MVEHPLITRSRDSDVTAVSRFAGAAANITAAQLVEGYRQELAAAPKRAAFGKRYFVGHDGVPGTRDETNRVEEHLAMALFNAYRNPNPGLLLPNGEPLAILDYQFPLKARRSDHGVGKVDLLGALSSGRLCVIELKRMSGGSPETPLRALLEGLAYTAIVQANSDAIAAEARSLFEVQIVHPIPAVMVMAPQAYWSYFQEKRAAGPWRASLAELANRITDTLDLPVLFLGLGACSAAPGLHGQPPQFKRPVTASWVLQGINHPPP